MCACLRALHSHSLEMPPAHRTALFRGRNGRVAFHVTGRLILASRTAEEGTGTRESEDTGSGTGAWPDGFRVQEEPRGRAIENSLELSSVSISSRNQMLQNFSGALTVHSHFQKTITSLI